IGPNSNANVCSPPLPSHAIFFEESPCMVGLDLAIVLHPRKPPSPDIATVQCTVFLCKSWTELLGTCFAQSHQPTRRSILSILLSALKRSDHCQHKDITNKRGHKRAKVGCRCIRWPAIGGGK